MVDGMGYLTALAKTDLLGDLNYTVGGDETSHKFGGSLQVGKLYDQSRKTVEQTSSKFLGESNKLFDRLVKEGNKLEGKGRKTVNDTVSGVRGDVESRVGKVRESAQNNWDKLEKVFEQRVARALSKLGVPTSEEIQELSGRVQELNTRVRDLAKAQQSQGGPAKSGAASKSTTA